jgi:hypothetical protein
MTQEVDIYKDIVMPIGMVALMIEGQYLVFVSLLVETYYLGGAKIPPVVTRSTTEEECRCYGSKVSCRT